jgi:hypothetical protein
LRTIWVSAAGVTGWLSTKLISSPPPAG